MIDAGLEAPAARGLTTADAAARLRRDGRNVLPERRRVSAARRFARQLLHFFALMLWAAAALAYVAGLPELAIAIALVIVVNAAFAFSLESRADRAAERLRSLLPMQVTVRRDGRRELIDAADVVVGDLLLLEAGDRIPADGVAGVAHDLLVDASLLTGESEPAPVGPGERLHAGTFVVEGEAEVAVDATGGATRLGQVARLTTATERPPSPLTRELRRVVHTIAVIAVAVGGAFFVVSLLLGTTPVNGFVFAVGVTVALVPEALLPTVTLSLAWGAEQLAHRQVLVRQLDAVETLGSTTFICTDKTGTLTLNQMTVLEAWTPGATARTDVPGYDPAAPVDVGGRRDQLLRAAVAGARCSTGYAYRDEEGHWRARGDPMEAALDVFARRLGADTDGDRLSRPLRARFPFDPHRRRMSTVVGDEVLVKGAPDAVVALCAGVDQVRVAAVIDDLTNRGLRVLAVAGRHLAGSAPTTAADAEVDLDLYGIVGLQDPPRLDVHDALAACRRAGIHVAMVTGDHPATAHAIAVRVGLADDDAPVLQGTDLPLDEAALGDLVDRDGVVIARVSPEDKLRVARALRARGHVVAMTGDGVNDGPALHEADIGIAMGASGTDVAREAADLVLLDDHFATIVGGIEQGRTTFLNVRRFLTYHLTDNVAEVTPFVLWALSGGRFPLALGVLQILALDIGTDTLSAVALGAEPPSANVLDRPPVKGRLMNGTVLRRAFAVLGPTVAVATMAAFVVSLVAAGWHPGETFPGGHALAAASGAAFMGVVIAQMANAFACRSSTVHPGRLGWLTNRLLPPAVATGLAVSLVVLFVGPVARRLGHAPPPLAGWVVAAAGAAAMLAVDAADKRRRGRRRR